MILDIELLVMPIIGQVVLPKYRSPFRISVHKDAEIVNSPTLTARKKTARMPLRNRDFEKSFVVWLSVQRADI